MTPTPRSTTRGVTARLGVTHPLARIVVALGASAGGTEALREVIVRLPANMAGVVIVQHMPPGFTAMFAESLDRHSQMEVLEAADGDTVRPGRVLVAPGGFQMRLVRTALAYQVAIGETELVGGHCPAVDVLFESVARVAGPAAVGAVLTGMGRDGAAGLLAMCESGASTFAQDEATSAVYGMPRMAWEMGGAQARIALPEMAASLVAAVRARLAELRNR